MPQPDPSPVFMRRLLNACRQLFALEVAPGNWTENQRQRILDTCRGTMKEAETVATSWYLANGGGELILTTDFEWLPVTPQENFWVFDSQQEAQAFANGYRVGGGFAFPVQMKVY